MATPQFNSQHSEIMLDVSAYHSSTESTPQQKPAEETMVVRSPIAQASRSDGRVRDSVERVEDSYQEEPLPRRELPQPTENEEEDELYAVSPKGRASMDAKRAARRNAQAQQPATMPKANPIDALLDAGATVPSSAQNVAAKIKRLPDEAHTSTPTHKHVALDVENSIATNAAIIAEKYAGGEIRKPEDIHTEDYGRRRNRDEHGNDGVGLKAPQSRLKSRGQIKGVRNDTSKAIVARKRSVGTADTVDPEAHGTSTSNGEAISDKSYANKRDDDGTTRPAFTTKSADPAQIQQNAQKDVSSKSSRGRPQRQAKQTALRKLRAKHRQVDGETSDDTTDDSHDDDSNFVVKSKPVKKATDGGRESKQLPTPVTTGNPSKDKAETRSKGKLKAIKPQVLNTTANVKKPQSSTAARGTPVPSVKIGRPITTVAHTEKKQTTNAEFQRLPADHQKTSLTSVGIGEQHKPKDVPSPKRPGALKRPARSHSRGRKPLGETPYEFPGSVSGTGKKVRSVSRASKSSTARAGPTRQRMQSESVKERVNLANRDLHLPPNSGHPLPKAAKAVSPPRKSMESKHKHDGSQPPAMSLGRESVQQHKAFTAESSRSNHAVDPELHGIKSKGRPTAPRQQPGSSQAQAITIEPDSCSDSSSLPSPRRPRKVQPTVTVQATSRHNDTGRPKTPAMIPSSPPGSVGESIYTLARDKPTIIAFSRRGPRNQGVSSARKDPGSAAVTPNAFSDYKSAKSRTPGDYAKTSGLAKNLFLPSLQHAHRPREKVKETAELRNVTTGDENVFDDFTKNGKNKALADLLRRPSNVAKELRQEDQDNGFAVIDDFEGTTLINDDEQPIHALRPATKSQIDMPPPKDVRRKKDSKTVSALILMSEKTTAEDTPRPEPARKSTNASLAKIEQVSVSANETITTSARDDTHKPEFLKKATKKLTASNAPPKHAEKQTAEQPNKQVRKRVSAEPQVGSPSKKTRVSQESTLLLPRSRLARVNHVPESETVRTMEPAKRLDRRKSGASRRTTQGSQGVDILGSPYPKDLEVPTQATALEVFLQQIGLSSDQVVSSEASLAGLLDFKAVPRMAPTLGTELMSSNGKPMPAAPYESSKAVTRIASGPFAEQLLAAKPINTSEANPFTSSRTYEPTDDHGRAATKFREALRRHGIDLNDRSYDRKKPERVGEQAADAEMTLLDPLGNTGKENQDSASSPGGSVTSSASSQDAAAKVLEDVGDWRNSLKPHQAHLFDSLVIAAHKLVRHMVDHETASRDIVSEYRRRGEIIVTELQRAHVKEYQQYTHNIQSWKKQAADELAAHGKKLKQSMRDAEKSRAERKKAQSVRIGFDDVLEELVAGLD